MKRALTLILIFLMAAEVCGQVLYAVNGKGLKEESYILVVDEMLPTSSLLGVKDVFKSYNRTNVVVCEQIEEASWERVQRYLLDSFSTLSATIGYANIGMVDSVLRADSKFTLGKVERLKPAAVRMIWESEICRGLYERGEDDMAMESYFQQVAIIEGKRVVALEDTVEYDYLSGDIETQTRRLLTDFRNGRDSVVRRYYRADSLYRAGDVRGLAEMEKKGVDIDEKVDRWVGKIAAEMKAERCFVVLHARYLKEIIDKLKKQGIKTKEVK